MAVWQGSKRYLITAQLIAGLGLTANASAESVNVKYRGEVDLKPFRCEWTPRSSLVKRLCYDSAQSYVLVNLQGTYYHYCEVPSTLVSAWLQADSMGRYYNAVVKGNFDCRVFRMPAYQ